MNEAEFLKQFRLQQPALLKWADSIVEEITIQLQNDIPNFSKKNFYKTEPSPRIKDEISLVTKAFQRKKYARPLEETTDKVGVRFVLLTTDDVDHVCQIIKQSSKWSMSFDKDYEKEKESKPLIFDYQSMHFILKPNASTQLDNVVVSTDICCEVQVRTLLQHAHAELSHFVLYKPTLEAKNKKGYERVLARSVALIETVDENFKNVMKNFSEDFAEQSTWLNEAISAFPYLKHDSYNKRFNEEFVDSFNETLKMFTLKDFKDFIDTHKFIFSNISKRQGDLYYDQPVILLMYFLANKLGFQSFEEKFQYSYVEIEDIFADLGISIGVD